MGRGIVFVPMIKRIVFFIISLMCLVFFSEMGLAKEKKDWHVSDYFKHLSKRYFNFSGDGVSSESLNNL